MAIIVGIGTSHQTDSKTAIQEAYQQAASTLNDFPPSFIMVLASPTTFDQAMIIEELNQLAPQSVIVGCSTSGEITSIAGARDHSIALMAIYSDQIKFISGIGHDIKTDARQAGRQVAQQIRSIGGGEKPKAAIILPDGLAGNGADIVRGVLDEFGNDFMVVGGSAGDDYEFKQTYQYLGKNVYTNSVIGIGLYGNFHFGVGVKHGWIPIGTACTVTKSEGNIVYEIDGRPAINIYEDRFGKDSPMVSKNEPFARMAITYPLGIVLPGSEEYLIRDPITVNDEGAITCAAEVPQGSQVYIMIGSREEAIIAAGQVASKAQAALGDHPIRAGFLFNCIARKKLLMGKKQEEIDKITNVIGSHIPLIGFYTYGEQAPLGGEIVTCSFHNETDVLFLLAE